MPINQNLVSYHSSIGNVLKSSQERVRNLIGSNHWPSDGEHKESILRKVISEFCPEIYRIGSGFVCYPAAETEEEKSSTHLDILITSKANPTLYRSGEFHFVTPECANAIVEVKSKLRSRSDFRNALKKLSRETLKIRESNIYCWSGLFVYDAPDSMNDVDRVILELLQESASAQILSAINCVCVDKNFFMRFWEKGQPESGLESKPTWHSYKLEDLAQAYFVNNLVTHLSSNFSEHTSDAWFPIHDSKEIHRLRYVYLEEGSVENFETND